MAMSAIEIAIAPTTDTLSGASVSCGLSVRVNAEHSLSELLMLSDLALYRAKAEGRNRVQRVDQPKPCDGEATIIHVA